MNYHSSHAAHIYHCANKNYEDKVLRERQLSLLHQHEEQEAESSVAAESSESQQRQKRHAKSLFENEFEEEDETSKRERLHLEEQERKRRLMLSEALDQFSEQSRLHRDKQLALLQVQKDANRKWSQIQAVKEKVMAIQNAASKTMRIKNKNKRDRNRNNDDDDSSDSSGSLDEITTGPLSSSASSPFRKFSSEHDQTAKSRFLGASKLQLPPEKVVYNSLTESALQQPTPGASGSTSRASLARAALTASAEELEQQQQHLRVYKMKGNLRDEFGCCPPQSYETMSSTATTTSKPNQNIMEALGSNLHQTNNNQNTTQGVDDIHGFNVGKGGSDFTENSMLFSKSRGLTSIATGSSASRDQSSALLPLGTPQQHQSTKVSAFNNSSPTRTQHHQETPSKALRHLQNSRKLAVAVEEAIFNEKMGGRYQKYPSLDVLLEEQKRMRMHADIFSERTDESATGVSMMRKKQKKENKTKTKTKVKPSITPTTYQQQTKRRFSTVKMVGVDEDDDEQEKKKNESEEADDGEDEEENDDVVPLLKQPMYNPRLLVKDQRILELLKETCGEFM